MLSIRSWIMAMAIAVASFTGNTSVMAQEKHEHPSAGPHKGVLAEWGEEEYHVEITFDEKNKLAVIYILDGSAKKAKPITSKEVVLTLKQKPAVTVKLLANPEKTDPQGSSSRFVGKHEAFGKHQDFEGTVSGKVGNKPYSGDFKAKHGHDHR